MRFFGHVGSLGSAADITRWDNPRRWSRLEYGADGRPVKAVICDAQGRTAFSYTVIGNTFSEVDPAARWLGEDTGARTVAPPPRRHRKKTRSFHDKILEAGGDPLGALALATDQVPAVAAADIIPR